MGNKDSNLSPLVPKNAKAAKYHTEIFVPQLYQQLQDKIRNTQLSILICGPNLEDPNNPLAKKRADTINELRKESFDAYTGEEIVSELGEMDEQNGYSTKPAHIYEMVAARNSEIVIVFRSSYGSVAELHDFLSDREIAHRLWVFADEAHKQGYSSNGRIISYEKNQRPVNYFKSPEDIDECKLLTAVIEIANNHRIAKFAEINGY